MKPLKCFLGLQLKNLCSGEKGHPTMRWDFRMCLGSLED